MIISLWIGMVFFVTVFGQNSLTPDQNQNQNQNSIDLDEAIKTIFTTQPTNFLNDYEEVQSGSTSENSFGAMQKCGEGEDRGVHVCVPYYLCNPKNNTVSRTGLTDGFGIIEIRFGYNSCSHPLEVCCSIPQDGKLYTSPEIKTTKQPNAASATSITSTFRPFRSQRTRLRNSTLFISNNQSFANIQTTLPIKRLQTTTVSALTNTNSSNMPTVTTVMPFMRPTRTFRSHRTKLIRPSQSLPAIRRLTTNQNTISVINNGNNFVSTSTDNNIRTNEQTTPSTPFTSTVTESTWRKTRTRSTTQRSSTLLAVNEQNTLPYESDLLVNTNPTSDVTKINTPFARTVQSHRTRSTTPMPQLFPSVKSSQGSRECGIRHPNGIDFKLTGNNNDEAEYGEFPWMTAILRKTTPDNTPPAICGGSLVTPNVVLTGAHCVHMFDGSEIKIRVGEWDTQTENERLPYQERNVKNIILHHDFDRRTLDNDIALLILDRSVNEADNVGTICLPPKGIQFNSKECYASGWGKDVFGKMGNPQVILKKIKLPIVSRRKCQYSLRRTRLGNKFDLHESFLCAGGEEGIDTCTGDGGSPLVCPDPQNPERYLQAGIVAWGIGCGGRHVPGVYADVARFRSWIDEQLQILEIDIRSYTP